MIGTDGIDPAHVAEVERWAGELLVPPGDSASEALAPGSPYRLALEEARAEIAAGRPSPSPEWRRRWALPLGLQRLLADSTPKLAGGLELRPHQVDALAGMLGALLGAIEREGEDAAGADENGDDEEPAAAAVEVEETRRSSRSAPSATSSKATTSPRRTRTRSRPPTADDDDDDDDDDEADAEPPAPDPGAARRYRFKHPTASGKTVAAAGFVDAAKITGVLILTHRRLLVDQFERDLKSQGYGRRLKPAVLRGHARARRSRRSRSRRTRGSSATSTPSTATCTASSSATRRTRPSATARRPPSAASTRRRTSA